MLPNLLCLLYYACCEKAGCCKICYVCYIMRVVRRQDVAKSVMSAILCLLWEGRSLPNLLCLLYYACYEKAGCFQICYVCYIILLWEGRILPNLLCLLYYACCKKAGSCPIFYVCYITPVMRRQDVALYVMSARLRLLYEDRLLPILLCLLYYACFEKTGCCPLCYVCYNTSVVQCILACST